MSKRFPIFQNHDRAICFSCEKPLAGQIQESGHAPGHGEYVQACTCGMRTWYDLSDFPLEALEAEHMQREAEEWAELSAEY